ncbi:response regulator [Ferrovum myxofaciens]|jgi:DNA-binding response OmpR family regulator|uniref:Response regulator n=3 Tax=root TaxID=1 RepID=A0A8F3DVJ1_9PROT|nr:response regulator [Ferrovum myxofaciens]MBW8028482.1 response regulator [Ferrovum sp.]KXW58133.1 transcriptional regulatory protein QseB [Ferrovum myxofaciens]MBU6994493.1 response regulator [Ferrovum myxofaciens]NDU90257.1 response regulator [Ferrovum sp.]QKE38365.1 MAG: response regulator [Ferrovum myxofaciens]
MRLLLVEDDPLLGDGLRVGLRQAGYAVDWVEDGQTAKFSLQSENYDLAVLDLGLPKIPGLELLKWLRAQAMTLPVLLLTARDTISDRVTGLDAGADDYLIKPFDLDELIARLRALSRRGSGLATPLLTYREISLDPAAHQVFKNDTLVELSAREFSLLHQLLLNIGRVQTRDQLETRLYGWGEEVESNSIEVHIHHLRKKLGNTLIRTLRGIGYVIDKP